MTSSGGLSGNAFSTSQLSVGGGTFNTGGGGMNFAAPKGISFI